VIPPAPGEAAAGAPKAATAPGGGAPANAALFGYIFAGSAPAL
jgi:hypothetical protein